jgi:hypothetical protein
MEQRLCYETESCSVGREISCPYRVHKANGIYSEPDESIPHR